VEPALVTTSYVGSSVGSWTFELESSSEVALSVELENIGRSFHGWVGYVGSGCGEDNRVCEVPYILESNMHPGFGDLLNRKKLVTDSNMHLSFNHPMPTWRLTE
jgi:hypothetical protein